MTNDYKDTLLKYLTGNLSNESKSNNLNYEKLITKESDISISSFFSITGYIQCKDSSGNLNGKTIVYGNINQENDEGFIALFKGTELVYVATKYNTGTTFGKFKYLDVDENGNYYGIDYSVGEFRVILLNNISEFGINGSEQIVLRNSYYLRGNLTNIDVNYSKFFVKKSLQSASYMIIETNASYDIRDLKACLFKINVGEENEWIPFTTSIDFSQIQYFNPLGYYVYFDKEDNPFIEYYAEVNKNNNKTSLNLYTNTSTTLGNEEVIIQDFNQLIIDGNTGYFYGNVGLMATASRTFYLYLGTLNSANKPILTTIKYSVNSWSSVFYILGEDSGTYDFSPNAIMFNVNNVPIIYFLIPIEQSQQTMTYEAKQGMGLLTNERNVTKQFPNLVSQNGYISDLIILVNNAYNMFNLSSIYYVIEDDTSVQYTSTWQIVYNPSNYNNEQYENKNSLIASNCLVYDTNDNLVFARNLYNYKVYNNRVMSVLNIPNNYLNDITIGNKTLLSETNTDLIENNDTIVKNIYEELFINYFLTMKMINKNDPISVENKNGAIRINQSASKVLDYENAKATKSRINYKDGTNMIGGITATIENGVATYQTTLYTGDKEIESIDIISEDENTIYQTIKGLNLEQNKYYNIKQDVYVE